MAEHYPFSMNRGNCSVTLWGLAHLNMCVVPVSSLIRTDWVMAKTQQGWFNKMECICSGPLDRNTHSTSYACQLVCISEFSKNKKKEKRNVCEVGILYNWSRQLKWLYKRKGSDSAARGWKYLRCILHNFGEATSSCLAGPSFACIVYSPLLFFFFFFFLILVLPLQFISCCAKPFWKVQQQQVS